MSKWPDGFEVDVRQWNDSWVCTVVDRRPGIAGMCLPGYTTRQDAESAALDWIRRRVGKPVTVPQPVLAERDGYFAARWRVDHVLDRLAELEKWFPTPTQADYPDEREHIAAADCNIYRCGLIGALRNSLRAELEMIREKL